MEEEIISKPKIKRTRKPKQVKEEYNNIDTIKTENLYEFDGVAKYSLGQGQ